MKKNLQTLVLLFVAICGYSQSQRTVLIEEFTQASCPPCEVTTPALNAIISQNIEKLVQIRYQTSWPGVDPMNEDNPEDVAARVSYYGVDGVPAVFADGVESSSPGVLPQALINSSSAKPGSVLITVEHALSADLSKINVTVRVKNEDSIAYSRTRDKLRVALIEEEISWSEPPGSTSITVFEAVMKRFFGGTGGIDVPDLAAGETWEQTFTDQAIPDVVYNFNKLGVVAWVQDDANKSVLNASHSVAIPVAGVPDLSIKNESTVQGGYCDYKFSPLAEVKNESGIEVASYFVDLAFDSDVVATKEITTPLAANESAQVFFDDISLPTGNTAIRYRVRTPAGDVATLNNITIPLNAGKAAAPGTTLGINFENDTPAAYSDKTIVETAFTNNNMIVIDAATLGGTVKLGGFGNSDKSVRINFFQWNPADVAADGSLIAVDQARVVAGAKLEFDYAFTTWSGSNDRLQVQFSTDCGSTFTTVWNKAGTALRTAPEVNSNSTPFRPSAAQWKKESIDLASFVGQDVMVRFFVTSAWGDMMYIDNVNLVSPSDVNELEVGESIVLAPNPADQVTNLSFELINNADVTVEVIDITGKLVFTTEVGKKLSGTFDYALNTANLNSGLYMVQINAGNKRVVKRLNIIH